MEAARQKAWRHISEETNFQSHNLTASNLTSLDLILMFKNAWSYNFTPPSLHCMVLDSLKAQWLLYVPPGLIFTNSTFCLHSVFMCFTWISEQTAIISLHNTNWLVFITETECVYCAVRAESLNVIQFKFPLQKRPAVSITGFYGFGQSYSTWCVGSQHQSSTR
jgi:hypothetical protein